MIDFTFEDEYIKLHIPAAAVWMQLAEELGEMQHHALKVARALYEDNPTPCNAKDEAKECVKEFGDVLNCVRLFRLDPDENEMKTKMLRWCSRIQTRLKELENEDT